MPFFWLPEDTLHYRARVDHVPYETWNAHGLFNTTDGNVVDYRAIRMFIAELYTQYNIKEIAYDRWQATEMVQNLMEDGYTMVPFGQGFRDMSPPTKELLRLVLTKQIAHDGNPVLRWMVDNAIVKTDPAGNIKMDKEKSQEKIDGAIAMVMALDRALRHEAEKASVYDEREMIVF